MIPQYPNIIPLPIAQNGNKNIIPLTTETAGLLTYNEGFPPITQVSVKAGGKAPQRADFNGAFYALSQHLFFLQAGGQYQWSAELDYNVGAVIQGSDNNQYLALQVSGPSSIGAKNPIDQQNTAYWEIIQTVKEHNVDQNAHKDLFDKVLPFFTGDFKVSYLSTMDGFLLCDGSAVSRETYADLFAVIRTTFGAGDGSTTFNLPDFRGRFIQGANRDLGEYKEAGLPNITGGGSQFGSVRNSRYMYGALFNNSFNNVRGTGTNDACGVDFDASRSNPIYGASDTVQPPAISLNVFIKY